MIDNKLKILIIDDEDSIRLSLASILELEGYEVKTAEDGFKAIELVKEESFDIVFSDIRMPGMSGNDAFKEIKKIRPNIVGVMMTAYAMSDLILDALNSGAFTCISKPFEIDTVLATIKDVANRPFAVVIDKEANIDKNFLNSLKNCGLNVAFSDIDSSRISFMFEHKPDIFIAKVNSEEEGTKNLEILKKIKSLFGEIPKTIIIEKGENKTFVDGTKDLGDIQYIKDAVSVAKIFQNLGNKNRKINIAMINMDDFADLNKDLKDKGFNLLYYSDSSKLFKELNDSFFDVVLANVKIDTNIVDFHNKLQEKMPKIGTIFILNDDVNFTSIKQKGCFYLNKPFEIDDVIDLINKITGKNNE